ncbi:BspA family leucine-rich repeat surface protein [Bifidobacterium sp. ESL0763]|uniref:BspA family leucine-rich repeat surface protein n=1 Tax=Bifidobacterium sp. ESL0763 TaxID=2983227 RepID=UPI0023F735C5|nr:BspA family leucine-rich repeat surface protein [Bifidobacterium sp. ESL0763]MDF7663139.1 BspA family leucine-rich repeat surface protein [Bifidobacterium sp. ESL0763]
MATLAAPAMADANSVSSGSGQAQSRAANTVGTQNAIACTGTTQAAAANGYAGWTKEDTVDGCALAVKAEGANNRMPSNAITNDVQHIIFIGPTKTKLDAQDQNRSNHIFGAHNNLVTFNGNGFLDTSALNDMSSMFSSDTALTQVNASGFDTSHVTKMGALFSGDFMLRQVNLSGFDTSKVTDMSHMFDVALRLEQIIGLDGFDTSKVTNMQFMFAHAGETSESGATQPIDLDLSNFDTGNVTDMSSMFADSGVRSIKGLENLNTSQVRSMSQMFSSNLYLKTMDLSGWNMLSVSSPITLPDNLNQITLGPRNSLRAASFYDSNSRWAQVLPEAADHDVSYTTTTLAMRTNSTGTYVLQNKRTLSLTSDTPEGYVLVGSTDPVQSYGYDAHQNVPNGMGGTANVDAHYTGVKAPANGFSIQYMNGRRISKDFTFNGWSGDNRTYQPNDPVDMASGNKTFSAKWTKNRDSRELNDAYIDGSTLHKDNYTNATWTVFHNAMTAADNVLNDGSKTQADVNKALSDLKDARNKLQMVPNKETLQYLYDETGKLNQGDYTPATWTELQNKRDKAQQVLNNTNATNAEVTDTFKALSKAKDNLQKKGDLTALQAAIDKARQEQQAGYTADSWTNLQTALAAAENVKGNENSTSSDVDTALNNLNDALNKLRVDKSRLVAAIGMAQGKHQSDFTAASWNALKDALDHATDVAADADATKNDVQDATDKLNDALAGLMVDKSELQAAVNQAKQDHPAGSTADKDKYTPGSLDQLQNAISAGQTVLDKPNPTKNEVDTAKQNLQNALNNLAEKGNKTPLQNLVNRYKDNKQADFDPSDATQWPAFTNALQHAKDVIDDANATQADVNAAMAGLVNAANALVPNGRQDLADDVAETTPNKNKYTAASWQPVQTAIDHANDVIATTPAPTAAEVGAAKQQLDQAKLGLVAKGDRTALDALLSQAHHDYPASDQGKYLPNSWNALQNAINAATNLPADATQGPIDQAKQNLQNAMNAMTKVPSKTVLQNMYNQYKANRQNDFDPANWPAFTNALQHAKDVLDNANASQTDVDDALAGLINAANALVPNGRQDLADAVAAIIGQQNKYTTGSWQPVQTAIDHANDVIATTPAPSKADVDQAKQQLDQAIAGLIAKGDKTVLNQVIDNANQKLPNQSRYTPGSWSAFLAALANAKSVKNDPNATQSTIDNAWQQLVDAITNLEPVAADNGGSGNNGGGSDNGGGDGNGGGSGNSWQYTTVLAGRSPVYYISRAFQSSGTTLNGADTNATVTPKRSDTSTNRKHSSKGGKACVNSDGDIVEMSAWTTGTVSEAKLPRCSVPKATTTASATHHPSWLWLLLLLLVVAVVCGAVWYEYNRRNEEEYAVVGAQHHTESR